MVAAFHLTVTMLRRIKSPMGTAIDEALDRHAPVADEVNVDVFSLVRGHLRPPVWPEYVLARDAVLACRLATGDYPGKDFIRPMVPTETRVAVYNATVFEINGAMEGLERALRDHAACG